MGRLHLESYLSQEKVNPLHPNISMHILCTVLYTFTKVQTRRICLTKSFLGGYLLLYSLDLNI